MINLPYMNSKPGISIIIANAGVVVHFLECFLFDETSWGGRGFDFTKVNEAKSNGNDWETGSRARQVPGW